jgi:alpha-L-fucosidase
LEVGRNAEWIMNYFRIPVAEYREMARHFNPVRFDARQWARLAKETGMKYLVVTAKHHDGFAMYHSKVSRYNIVDWTSYGRDPLKELAEACRLEGIRFCVYYSHREDWDHPDGYGNDWDYAASRQHFERYLEEKSKPQLRELLTEYGPIGLVWFDRGLETPRQAAEFVDIVRSLQPACLINGRVGNYGQELMGDYQNMSDNGMPPGGLEEYWETPQTLNRTWGYSKFDEEWKSTETVVRRLIEIASKGGNYLLNIGPKGDGSIPQPALETLGSVGAWIRANGDAIYGTSAAGFRDLPWGRCTVKGRTLYLHVLDQPADRQLRLPGLKTAVRKAYPLGSPGQTLPIRKDDSVLTVELPKQPVPVIALELAAKLEVEPPVVRQKDGQPIRLDYMSAVTSGNAVTRYNRSGQFHISKWTQPEDRVRWVVGFSAPGSYRVEITYAAQPDWGGPRFRISMGGQSIVKEVQPTGGWYEYRTFDIGRLQVVKPGNYVVEVRPDAAVGHYLMYLQSLGLELDRGRESAKDLTQRPHFVARN